MAKEFSKNLTPSGLGCITRTGGLPPHNPMPSTDRGHRRHAARSHDLQNRAKKAWDTPRSTMQSKHQKKLNGYTM